MDDWVVWPEASTGTHSLDGSPHCGWSVEGLTTNMDLSRASKWPPRAASLHVLSHSKDSLGFAPIVTHSTLCWPWSWASVRRRTGALWGLLVEGVVLYYASCSTTVGHLMGALDKVRIPLSWTEPHLSANSGREHHVSRVCVQGWERQVVFWTNELIEIKESIIYFYLLV